MKRTLFLLTPFLIALAYLSFYVVKTFAQAPATNDTLGTGVQTGFGFMAAGLSVGLSGIGAGIAINGSTSAGMAAMVERPELTTWVLVFAGLGEGLAIYGLVLAIMILGRL